MTHKRSSEKNYRKQKLEGQKIIPDINKTQNLTYVIKSVYHHFWPTCMIFLFFMTLEA